MLEHRSVVVPPRGDCEGGGGVGLSALVAGDHLDLSAVRVATLGNVKVPHAVIDQLVSASLKKEEIGIKYMVLELQQF